MKKNFRGVFLYYYFSLLAFISFPCWGNRWRMQTCNTAPPSLRLIQSRNINTLLYRYPHSFQQWSVSRTIVVLSVFLLGNSSFWCVNIDSHHHFSSSSRFSPMFTNFPGSIILARATSLPLSRNSEFLGPLFAISGVCYLFSHLTLACD